MRLPLQDGIRMYWSFFFAFVIVGCSYSEEDFYLNEHERGLIGSFHMGDTIYYQNLMYDLDTLLITGVDSIQKQKQGWLMAKPASNNVFVSFRTLPVDSSRSIIQNGYRFDTLDQQLLSIAKLPQNKEVIFSFEYNRFYSNIATLDSLYTDTIMINGHSLSHYYIIESQYSNSSLVSDRAIDRIYWTKQEGLAAYKNRKGDYWVKVFK